MSFSSIPVFKRLIPSLKKRLANLFWPHGWLLKYSKNGALFLLNHRNFVDRHIALFDTYEQEQFKFLAAKIREYDCDVFVDIGANIGYYSILIAKQRLANRIVAFEPDKRSLYQLEANILVNKLIGNIEVVPKAVNDKNGYINFLPQSENSTGQSHVGDGAGAIKVECISIDDCVKVTGQRIFVKIDVESHELEVIEGMKNLLANNKVFLQIESYREKLERLKVIMAEKKFTLCHQIGHDFYFTNFA